MAITRIDVELHGEDDGSYVCLNPGARPGSVLFVGSGSPAGQIGEQVAQKLAVEHFVDGVLRKVEQGSEATPAERLAHELLEVGFKNSNASVYEFSHRLAAGGRFRATVMALSIHHGYAAAGRVGAGTAYLVREGQVFPFFSAREPTEVGSGFVGKDSIVDVELVSVPLEAFDTIVLFGCALDAKRESDLLSFAPSLSNKALSAVLKAVRSGLQAELVLAIRVGPEALYLAEEVV